jgi:hypothetical protein
MATEDASRRPEPLPGFPGTPVRSPVVPAPGGPGHAAGPDLAGQPGRVSSTVPPEGADGTAPTDHETGLTRGAGAPGQRWHLSPRRRQLAGKALAACVVIAYSWIAAASAPFSMRALIAVLIPGAVVGVLAYGRPPGRIPAPEHLDVAGFSYWAICIAALFEWEAAAFKDNSRWWHPSLTDLVNPLISPHPVRTAAFVIWLLVGWGLVRR